MSNQDPQEERTPADLLLETVRRMARRDATRSEASVQTDIANLLWTAELGLSESDVVLVEAPVGSRKRIDVQVGATVIEVKRDLRQAGVRDEAITQLTDYVRTRTDETGGRYVGVLTDGCEWACYHLTADGLTAVATHEVVASKPDVDALLRWLEGVMATLQGIRPVPHEVSIRLGAGSSAHALDRATLADLYQRHADSASVQIKRQLWAKLLTTALGTQFEDTDELFVEHTLLVNTADIVAHAVLGLELHTLNPSSLLSGARFEEAELYGVVEEDFFDWVVEVPGGETFIRTLARRLARFEWSAVEHDVLKSLYESVIEQSTRKKLGEYYTPDWLAGVMVQAAINDPLTERVLDPACGSGTFLFHAVRRYLDSADNADLPTGEALEALTRQVIGMDLHPVSVALARVTYLLAIGRDRIAAEGRPAIRVPVFLGDSMQWRRAQKDLFTAGHLEVHTEEGLDLFPTSLRFPDDVLADAKLFDDLVRELASRAAKREPGAPVAPLVPVFRRLGVADEHHQTIEGTFVEMCRLHDEGRDHIWGYYVRNLARPTWLSQPANRVDVLIGNPPWLAYRHMTAEMQEAFKAMCDQRGLWHGAKVATHEDLSALFVVRCADRYLRKDGRFAFVMPSAALHSGQFKGFRSGRWSNGIQPLDASFDKPWDLRGLRPHFFPRAACVVLGLRTDGTPTALPDTCEVWTGKLPASRTISWTRAASRIERNPGPVVGESGPQSPYHSRFSQGASIVPRVLFVVRKLDPGPLGVAAGRVRVESLRTANEKEPWKHIPSMQGVVESEFVRGTYFGEHVLPFRLLPPTFAVLPWAQRRLLQPDDDLLDGYKGLRKWWSAANQLWLDNRSSDRLTLSEQLDYRGKLTNQLPALSTRLVYNKSGMHLVAAIVRDIRMVIDHSLYWATLPNEDEAHYLCAVLNAPQLTRLVRPLMSYGKDERHVDKYVWQLPIPRFDASAALHVELSRLGRAAEGEIAKLELPDTHFSGQRRYVREHLAASETGRAIEDCVARLLTDP